MRQRSHVHERSYEEEPQYTWIAYAFAMLLVGGIAGYILAITGAPAAMTTAREMPAATGTSGLADDVTLRTYRDILTRDPKNVHAAVAAGNLLYDAKRYAAAVPFYQQAFAINSADINVSTDLGTALWYSGRTDEALAQYSLSLAITPTHAQTLFNVGIVKSEGHRDYAGAIAAWETLLASNPEYPNAAAVRTMIAEARQKGAAQSR